MSLLNPTASDDGIFQELSLEEIDRADSSDCFFFDYTVSVIPVYQQFSIYKTPIRPRQSFSRPNIMI